MTNVDRLGVALSQWAFKLASNVLPQIKIPTDSAVGKFMSGILRVDPSSYNIWNELGFLAEPTIQVMITPFIHKFMSAIPEDQIRDVALRYADAFCQRAREKGSVNLFGIDVGQNAFEDLKHIINANYEQRVTEDS